MTAAGRQAATRAHGDARTPEGRAALTRREREVAGLVASGATDREIARSLGISPRTVHKHLQQVYRKLGLTNRSGLIVLLLARSRSARRRTRDETV